ncbi:FtsW/RodA/SpoVE family cell cycle protein [Chlamydiifrater phoenicopteri]|uniref:FtsW/RodA/SpoVE family cell cycle protein n=1 Tax=Chlamydiifrater phoenicopteri TaxID=2681469 RepID=UPI001BCC0B6C|nr:FtsW/RodA/SpoVE family cell cycle protein [Chlamydiifrater phoenicopteri]
MLSFKSLRHLNYWSIVVISFLMVVSLIVVSSMDPASLGSSVFLTTKTCVQMRHFAIGWIVFFLCSCFDYSKLKTWAFPVYLLTLLSLAGLFLAPAVQNVHRWYRIPLIHMSFQPSEYAKLSVVIMLGYVLEISKYSISSKRTALVACLIVFIPFVLILREPDLGTALVLCPVAWGIFYLANVYPPLVRISGFIGGSLFLFTLLVFTGVIPHEKVKPYALKVLKEYQYERLNPVNHHQRASLISIGLGGVFGRGWKSGEFAGRGWLPYGYTDSVFPALGEEFGLVGLIGLLGLYYSLIYFGCRTIAVASDNFGRLLSAGITVYISMHILINISMMCGILPITGVPLVLISYGGSSVIATMASLGLLQSIYARRFRSY